MAIRSVPATFFNLSTGEIEALIQFGNFRSLLAYSADFE